DRAEPGGECEVCWQVDRRMQEELTIRGVGLRRAPGRVGAAGVRPNVDAQLGVAGAHPPPVCEQVLSRQLRSEGLAVLAVADNEGDRSRRVDLLQAAKPVVRSEEHTSELQSR